MPDLLDEAKRLSEGWPWLPSEMERANELLAELAERVEQAEQDLRYARSRWMYWENRARRAVKVKS